MTISTIYVISTASSHHFHEQQRIAQTQMSLRMAMMQIRDDFERAGLFGTPNSALEQRCRAPAFELRAVEFQNDVDTGVLPNAAENGVTADRIRLVGAFAAPAAYLISTSDSLGGRFFLQQEWQGFRRDFGEGSSFRVDDFTSTFAPGRVAHIVNQRGMHFFSRVQGSDALAGAVDLQPIGVGGHCVGGLSDGALLSVLSRVEYIVINPRSEAGLANLLSPETEALSDARGLTPSTLIRRELEFGSDTPIPGTERIVLEYVADFNLDFVLDRAADAADPPDLRRLSGADAAAAIAAAPQQVRSVQVSLSARTAGHEPRFRWAARGAGEPLIRYRTDPDLPGAARVRTQRAEILLPNLAYRVLR